MADNPTERKLSFDEFRLYYESTEKVTDRRLETNRWNYSVCVAMLIAIAVLTKWSLTSVALLWIGFIGVAILSIMAVLFCVLWVGQIRDFKNLNSAKFAVLNAMAPDVEFDPEKPGSIVSYRPFEKEWDMLDQSNALQKPKAPDEGGKSYRVALKATTVEYFIPKAFGVLFTGIFIGLLIALLSNWPPTRLVQQTAPVSTSSPQGQKH